MNLFYGGNQLTIMPDLAMGCDSATSGRARTLAQEAAGLILADGLLWERPASGLDREPLLARYPWGMFSFRGMEMPGNLDGIAGVARAVPHSYHLIGVTPARASTVDESAADRLLFHAQLCHLAMLLIGHTTAPAKVQDAVVLALRQMRERLLDLGDESTRSVVAHSRSITVSWPVDVVWLDVHPELQPRGPRVKQGG